MFDNRIAENGTDEEEHIEHDDIPYLPDAIKSPKITDNSCDDAFYSMVHLGNGSEVKVLESAQSREEWNTREKVERKVSMFFKCEKNIEIVDTRRIMKILSSERIFEVDDM